MKTATLPAVLLDQQLDTSGHLAPFHLHAEGELFHLTQDEALIGQVSATVIEGVCRRYSRPLEDGLYSAKHPGARLSLSETLTLRVWLYKAPVDLESKRYLVLEEDGKPPLAVLARQVVAALRFVCTPPSER